ncbi:hypothetical protein MIND_00435800 [Mycena indigotica]|uniref:FAD/NAD(P)-binding domain-containing protein n=1 Tax=Mycena indigotica TaxID=2126181 RepID=A0A8H6SXG1_9AGAR|nr:uncharacterized protein MIND_00435800 [Mycena indigotica]KAF7306446.1 hypothetical protein MIND_00435800 [Mycena indigotica]
MPRTVKVAVVGSGLAGLTAGYLLTSSHPQDDVEFDVHIFEKTPTLGMDSSSMSIGSGDGEWRIDVPMRSFQGGYYPHLIELYRQLGVAFRPKDFSYCFSVFSPPSEKGATPLQTTMIYNGASGREGVSMPAWLRDHHLKQKSHRAITRVFTFGLFLLATLHLVVCYIRLLFLVLPPLRSRKVSTQTFEQWTQETTPRHFIGRMLGWDSMWQSFTQDILVPLFSAVCTAPEADIMTHPVEDFLDYIWLTLGTHHFVVEKGVRDVVSRLTSNMKNVHLSSQIVGIHVDPSNASLASIECAAKNGTVTYDGFHHVVFATQATRACPMLSTYATSLATDPHARQAIMAQINALEAFHYVRTVVINHTDESELLLPSDPSDRRDLNLVHCPPSSSSSHETEKPWSPHRVSSDYTMATHILTSPSSTAPAVFQTTNPFVPIHEEHILSVATLERAVLTLPSKAALRGLCKTATPSWYQCPAEMDCQLGDLQGAGRLQSDAHAGIWLVGSYASVGIPLLEGCVVSAKNVYLAICKTEGIPPSVASQF